MATKGGIDVLIDYLALKGQDATEDDWDLLQKAVTLIAEKSGKHKGPNFKDWRTVESAGKVLNGKAIVADEVKAAAVLNGALVVRGSVTADGSLVSAVVFANGDLNLKGAVNSILVCDGDVTFKGGAVGSVLIASGSIKSDGSPVGSVLAARGTVTGGGGAINSTIKEKENVPLGAVKFFASSQLGAEAALADGKVRVDKVAAETPLAKAGLQKGDVVTALGETKIDTVEAFRKALRRQLAAGKAVLKVRRGEQEVVLSAQLLEGHPPEKKPDETKPEKK